MVLDRLGLYRANIWLSKRAMGKRASSATPIIVALMVLMLDVSVGVSGSEWEINNPDTAIENVESEVIPDIPPSCVSQVSARSKTGPLIFHQMESIGLFKNLVGGLTSGMIKMPMGWTIDYNG